MVSALQTFASAVASGDPARVRNALASCTKDAVNTADPVERRTPLHVACLLGGDTETGRGSGSGIVSILLEHGADCLAVCTGGNTPLHYAALCGDHRSVALLLDAAHHKGSCRRLVAARNQQGDTALILAAVSGSPEAVRMLLASGASVSTANKSKMTPLHCAAGLVRGGIPEETDRRRCEVATQLLAKSGNKASTLAQQDGSGNAPLHFFAAAGAVHCVRFLLESGADSTVRNAKGKLALDEAPLEGECRVALAADWAARERVSQKAARQAEKLFREKRCETPAVVALVAPKKKKQRRKRTDLVLLPAAEDGMVEAHAEATREDCAEEEIDIGGERDTEVEQSNISAIDSFSVFAYPPPPPVSDPVDNDRVLYHLMQESLASYPRTEVMSLRCHHLFGLNLDALSISQLEVVQDTLASIQQKVMQAKVKKMLTLELENGAQLLPP